MAPKNQNQKNRASLLQKAAHFLKYRPRSSYELERYLSTKTQDTETVQAVIADLVQMGLQNDREFCLWFLRSRLNHGYGPRFIQSQLKSRFRLEPTLIQQTLSEIPPADLISSARFYLNKHRLLGVSPLSFPEKSKAYRLLYQRGFTSTTIKAAIDEKGFSE